MTDAPNPTSAGRNLRLWPGVAAVALQWLARFVLPLVVGGNAAYYGGVQAALVLGLVVVAWWLFSSRAPWAERLAGVGLIAAALFLTPRILHESIATGGMGFLFYMFAVPTVCLAFVAWAVASRRWSARSRWLTMVAAVLAGTCVWGLFRTAGISARGAQLAWRWSPSAEERLLATAPDEPPAGRVAEIEPAAKPEWPGFRGPRRDGVAAGSVISADWVGAPPTELWRRPIGPGWSSFAVLGDRLYTQEQRGEEEIVSCYDAASGEPLWRHRDRERFWESQGGAGPRATPAVGGGRVFALGASGTLNALDAGDGALLWSRSVVADAEKEVPYWGFSGSPLVLGDSVYVAAAGRLAAYDAATGEALWVGPDGGGGYSSPHRLEVDGVEQVVLLGGKGATSLSPADGSLLWRHEWPGFPMVQPARAAGGELLISMTENGGLRRLAVSRAPGGWEAEERWTSIRLKPYFSDFVVHAGHAYGFDGSILAAIELEGGERRWKGGRYGYGQLVLVPGQDLLLVITERGDLALVAARPDRFHELARVPAIEGKTWNHPVLVGARLYVRNGEEMAAFDLTAPPPPGGLGGAPAR